MKLQIMTQYCVKYRYVNRQGYTKANTIQINATPRNVQARVNAAILRQGHSHPVIMHILAIGYSNGLRG